MEPRVLLVLTTVPDAATAERLARLLVEARLAACVNIVPGLRSVYRWQGAVEVAEELQLVIKTSEPRYRALEEALRSHHPYELPEIVALPVAQGARNYLRWIADESAGQDGVYV